MKLSKLLKKQTKIIDANMELDKTSLELQFGIKKSWHQRISRTISKEKAMERSVRATENIKNRIGQINKIINISSNMENNIVTKMSLLNIQVCSSESYDEALEWVRLNDPAGTTNNWQKDERPEVAPVSCDSFSDRKHYIFTC